MRIVIDMQGAQTSAKFRGIGRYTMGLGEGLIKNNGGHEIILVLSGFIPKTEKAIRSKFRTLLPDENIRTWYAPRPTEYAQPQNKNNRIIAEMIYQNFILSLQPDVLLVSSVIEGMGDDSIFSSSLLRNRTLLAMINYDIIPYLAPQEYLSTPIYQNWYMEKFNELIHSDLILSISEFSKEDLLRHTSVLAENVTAIGSDTDSCFSTEESACCDSLQLKRWGISKDFVFYAGGSDERKNVDRLIIAYSQLSEEIRDIHQLVIACGTQEHKALYFQELAFKNGLTSTEIVTLGYISNDELKMLYSSCTLFVFPSLYEGFGLTPLEAMRCGAPVISSNKTSLPEVISMEDAMFDPENIGSMKEKMNQALTDPQFLEGLKKHSAEQNKKFSWNQTAQRCIKVFEKKTVSQCALPNTEAVFSIEQLCNSLAPYLSKDYNCVQLAHDIALTFPEYVM